MWPATVLDHLALNHAANVITSTLKFGQYFRL